MVMDPLTKRWYISAMNPADIIAKIRVVIPDAQVDLVDLTGTKDHWQATIVSDAFEGMSLLKRQRMIYGALAEEMKGPIHALSMKVLTVSQAAEQ